MKSQSSIEFLSTYGFVFLVIGLAVAIIFFVASYNNSVVSTQCKTFGGLTCNFVGYYVNATYGYSIITVSVSNAQTSPISINSINVTVGSGSANGICAPNFLYQGQEATCVAALPVNSLQNSFQTGSYSIGAGFCVSQVNSINSQGCSYIPSNYTGSFSVYNESNDTMPFSVIVAYLPGNVQLQQEPTSPIIPSNYIMTQNGDFVPVRNNTGFKYAFGTSEYVGSGSFTGFTVLPYPSILSVLSSNSVPCSPPYQSIEDIAYSAFYMPGSSAVSFGAYSDNAIEVYYKKSTWSNWLEAFSGAGWSSGTHTSTELEGSNTISKGYYQIAVVNVNTCGNGMQAVSVNGIGQ